MKIDQYNRLIKIVDKILLNPLAKKETIAIPWLHIIREHPVFLKKYKQLFLKNSCLENIINTFLKSLRNKIGIFKVLIQALFRREQSNFLQVLDLSLIHI